MTEHDVRIPPAAGHAGGGARQRLGGLPSDGGRPLHLLPAPAEGRSLRDRGAAGQGAPAAADAERDRPPSRAAVIAFALGHPGLGPRRISAELAREKWGGIRISEHGVWRVLRRVGLNTPNKRLALIARHQDRYERRPEQPPPERHIDATEPGDKVQLDCFYVGRLSGTKGTVWQYTAIDVASAFAWAQLRTTERNPRARHTRDLLHRVASELKAAGWKLGEVTTDNGSEFRSRQFRDAVED